MKDVMLSVRPEWCEKILSGEKTAELRKTRPKLEPPFRCHIYCTMGKPDLNIPIPTERLWRDYRETGSMQSLNCPLGNGKVIGEFVCDQIYEMAPLNHAPEDIESQLSLTREQIVRYLKGKGSAWHISDLHIYDQPRNLKDFGLNRPPQSWCYIEDIPETEEVFSCRFCGHESKWGSGDDIHGSLWHCDACGATFCEKCFIEEHGEQAFYEMLQSGEYIRCPECLRKANADVKKSLFRKNRN